MSKRKAKMILKRNTKTRQRKGDGKEPAAYSAVRVQLEIIIPYLNRVHCTTVMLLMHLSFVYFLNSREIHSLFMQSQTGQTSVSRERESLSLAPSCVSKAMLLLCTLLNMRSMQITNHCTIHVWVLTIKLLLAAASVIVIACSQVTRTIERK